MILPEHLMSSKMASDAMGVTTRTLLNLRKRGMLNPIFPYGEGPGKPVLYRRAEVEGFFTSIEFMVGQPIDESKGSPAEGSR